MTNIIESGASEHRSAAINDPAAALPGMFTDPRFREIGRYKYFGVIDGAKVGVVLITKNPRYATYAANKGGLESLLAIKRAGKLDHAYAVWARVGNGSTYFSYVKHDEAEHLFEMMSKRLLSRPGAFGEFWAVPDNFPAEGIDDCDVVQF